MSLTVGHSVSPSLCLLVFLSICPFVSLFIIFFSPYLSFSLSLYFYFPLTICLYLFLSLFFSLLFSLLCSVLNSLACSLLFCQTSCLSLTLFLSLVHYLLLVQSLLLTFYSFFHRIESLLMSYVPEVPKLCTEIPWGYHRIFYVSEGNATLLDIFCKLFKLLALGSSQFHC